MAPTQGNILAQRKAAAVNAYLTISPEQGRTLMLALIRDVRHAAVTAGDKHPKHASLFRAYANYLSRQMTSLDTQLETVSPMPPVSLTEFGNRLIKLARQYGMSTYELALKMGVPPDHVNGLAYGLLDPDPKTVSHILDALGVPDASRAALEKNLNRLAYRWLVDSLRQ